MRTTHIAALGIAILLGGGIATASAAGGAGPVRQLAPAAGPALFNHPQQNPYFPLEPGTVYRYRGTDEGEHLRERVTVTPRTKEIQGVETTVVRDVLRRSDGTLAEKTHDWYAADNDGNVWYFGENTATYDDTGKLESREGSWKAGVDGAVAGTIMPADPGPTDAYRQEFWRGHAEDQAWIVQRHLAMTVPYARFDHVLRSFEWTRLEPRVVSLKFYAPGIGIIREKDMAGGSEVFELVGVSHG